MPTIDEAINGFENELAMFGPDEFQEWQAYVRLGIEALKWYQEERKKRGAIQTMWLSGETHVNPILRKKEGEEWPIE